MTFDLNGGKRCDNMRPQEDTLAAYEPERTGGEGIYTGHGRFDVDNGVIHMKGSVC